MSLKGDAALTYLRRGWAVVPGVSVGANGVCPCSSGALCDSPGKHPKVKWKPYQTALPAEVDVVKWWRQWPDANVMVLTGAQSGIVAVDIDPRHQGHESLLDLGELPPTLTSLTGGGGQHLIYAHPGYEMRNAAGLLPGIDFRGDGGYIVAPPSSHSSGRAYAWDVGEPDDPVDLPEKIRTLYSTSTLAVGTDAASAARKFDPEKMLIEPIPSGRRNETLVRITGHYAADGRPYHDLLRTVLGCNYDLCQPPLERAEVVALVESIFNTEQQKRRLDEAVVQQLNGGAGGDIPDPDHTSMARQAWARIDVPGVVDWYVILGETTEYVLITDQDEARLGDDLTNQNALRKFLLNQIRAYLKPIENKHGTWNRTAHLLRRLAREVYSEPTHAAERLDEWIAAYAHDIGPAMEPGIDERMQTLRNGPAVIDGRLYLKPEGLVRFMENTMAEKVRIGDLRKLMKRAGWEPATVNTGTSTTRAWFAPSGGSYTRED